MSEAMFVPMPIITPLFNRPSSGGEVEHVYPLFAEVFFVISLIAALTGLVWLAVVFCLSIITGDDFKYDLLEKPHSLSFVLMFGGLVLLLISAILLVITGQPIEGAGER